MSVDDLMHPNNGLPDLPASGEPIRWRASKNGRKYDQVREGLFDMIVPNTDGEMIFVKIPADTNAFNGGKDTPRYHRVKIKRSRVIADDGD